MNEIWRTHPVYTNYEVSDAGRVRRVTGGRGATVGRILKPRLRCGYLRVAIHPFRCQCDVHRLVLETFVGPRPNGEWSRHLNGKRADNRLANLQWGTASENYADSIQHGTASRGMRNGRRKLEAEEVREIRTLYATGEISQRALAKRFDVTYPTIQAIVENRSWRHLL